MCLGPTEPWELFPEFIFNYPGTWTIRFVEHCEHPGVSDYSDGVWEKEVAVTGQADLTTIKVEKRDVCVHFF